MTCRIARRLAPPSEIRPDVEALVAAAHEVQVRADLLVTLVAEANVHGIVHVGDGLAVGAARIWGAAVRVRELLVSPRRFCNSSQRFFFHHPCSARLTWYMDLLIAFSTEAQYV